MIATSDWRGMLRRLILTLVVVIVLAGCNQTMAPYSETTRLVENKIGAWFIGVAVVGLLLAAWASRRITRDRRNENAHYGHRRKRHPNASKSDDS
jgi:uncharacterized integral membrane protein